MIEVGTRTRANQLHIAPPATRQAQSFTRDIGMSKLASGSFTFGGGQVSGANGSFPAFVAGDLVVAEGTNRNDGYFTVTGADSVNQAFLTLSPAPNAEGPIAATVRTA